MYTPDRQDDPETLPDVRPTVTTVPVGTRWSRGGFRDRLADPLPRFGEMLRAFREKSLRPDVSDADRIPVRPAPLPAPDAGRAWAAWVGHATFVLRIGGLTVLTDPLWSPRIPGVGKRLTPVGVPWEDLPRIDAVVISHNHYDHLDAPTIRRLPRDTAMFVPANLGAWFRGRGFTTVTELDWWEEAELAGVRFGFVPAKHWSRRGLLDTCRSLWGGWVLTDTAGTRLYFAGDTGHGPHFAEVGAAYPGVDLALMPVGAFAPRDLLRDAHVDPEEAVRGCLEAGARRMATMHWGTFPLSAEPLLSPPRLAREAWAEAGLDPADLWDLAVGESRVLD